MFTHIQNFYNSLVLFLSKYLFSGANTLHYQLSGGITGLLVYFTYTQYFGAGLMHSTAFQYILLLGYSMFGITTLVDTLRTSILVRFRSEEPKENITHALQEILREYLCYSGLIQAGYYLGAIEFIYLVVVLHVPLVINVVILHLSYVASEYGWYLRDKSPLWGTLIFLELFSTKY